MKYQTYLPDKELNYFINCYWTLEDDDEIIQQRQTIVPDGCMEMIFHYGDLYRQYPEGSTAVLQPRCFVMGQLTGPLNIEPTGRKGIFSVRFHPDGFLPFFAIDIKVTQNFAIPLKIIYSGRRGKF